MKYSFLILLLTLFLTSKSAKQPTHVEPPFWWISMKNTHLQLMVNGNNIQDTKVEIKTTEVVLKKVHRVESPNYLFLDLEIQKDAKAGIFDICFKKDGEIIYTYKYELKERREKSAERQGFGPEDLIYLLMPDRFSNGNTSNDNIKEMADKANRANPDGRHGGDIQGITNHLQYFNTIGVTAIWINPLLENNMPKYSYHGYAITDYYKIDARFGSNADYQSLCKKAAKTGLKVIQDMVFNHCASGHWWMKDLPTKDWVHQFPVFTRSNYRSETLMDPHASELDKKIMSEGWFDKSMPDLNQKNPLLATYLIQNSIWWIEYADLQGIRMDTYPYADQDFMTKWVKAVYMEYPNFNIVGETWMQSEAQTAWFQNNSFTHQNKIHLQSVTDFPMCYSINGALSETDGWTTGIAKIYMTLSKDYLYLCPDSNLIFLDNHDVSRFASNINSDMKKYKIGIGILATMRGIPMIYYGTEIMMTGKKEEGDGGLRADFPGGWDSDSTNVFLKNNLSTQQAEAKNYFTKVFRFRNKSKALQSGSLTQYIPEDGSYIYFRDYLGETADGEIIMVIVNNNNHSKTIDLKRFRESFKGRENSEDILTHTTYSLDKSLKVEAKSITILKITR